MTFHDGGGEHGLPLEVYGKEQLWSAPKNSDRIESYVSRLKKVQHRLMSFPETSTRHNSILS